MNYCVCVCVCVCVGGGGGGGGQVCIHVQSMRQTRGVRGHTLLRNFDFGPFIRHNLVKSGTLFT